jgi:lipopolysaccharide export system protein LptA
MPSRSVRAPCAPSTLPPYFRGSALVLALALAAACAPAASAAAAPSTETSSPGSPPARLPVDVTGATRIEYDAATQQYTFQGPRVVIVRGTERLEAPVVVYDAASRRASLPEGGTVSTPTMSLGADQMTVDLGIRHILAEGHVTARFLDQGVWTALTAGRAEADDRPESQLAEASGDAVVVREDQQLRGDRITYDRKSQHGEVLGHAELIRGTDHLWADHVSADLAAREAEAAGHVVLERAAEGTRGSADRATYSERAQAVVLAGHVMLERGRDTLTAEQITLHLDRHLAVAEGRPRLQAYPEEGQP